MPRRHQPPTRQQLLAEDPVAYQRWRDAYDAEGEKSLEAGPLLMGGPLAMAGGLAGEAAMQMVPEDSRGMVGLAAALAPFLLKGAKGAMPRREKLSKEYLDKTFGGVTGETTALHQPSWQQRTQPGMNPAAGSVTRTSVDAIPAPRTESIWASAPTAGGPTARTTTMPAIPAAAAPGKPLSFSQLFGNGPRTGAAKPSAKAARAAEDEWGESSSAFREDPSIAPLPPLPQVQLGPAPQLSQPPSAVGPMGKIPGAGPWAPEYLPPSFQQFAPGEYTVAARDLAEMPPSQIEAMKQYGGMSAAERNAVMDWLESQLAR